MPLRRLRDAIRIMSNPFFDTWDTPYGLPPFEQINDSHYEEAFERGFAEHAAEVAAIVDATDAPTFANTIEALERSGALLERVAAVFYNLSSSDSNDTLQSLEQKISPRFAAHSSAIWANPALFARIDAVGDADGSGDYSAEQRQLLDVYRTRCVRAGAALADEARAEVKGIDEELALLETRFGQNVLNDTNVFELVLSTDEELSGLPDSVREAAAAEAEARGKPGKYVFTISRSSITPFLQYADNRELRERIYSEYTRCGDNGNDNDNNTVLARIASLRARRADIMGFESHAHFMLDERMAKTPERVNQLLDEVWGHAQTKVREEAADLQARIQSEGGNFKLQPWDWWYYTEKVRSDKFDLDANELKPYFLLENVRDGAFRVANRLYGIRFEPVPDASVYHPDVVCYEVLDSDDSLIGLFYVDYFLRSSKRGGAWMSTFREQQQLDGEVRPIVVNCCNFTKADPCLLDLDEVRTLFHEFGHGLHGLLSNVKYRTLSCTNVKNDFVELPSQIMEHWAVEPEVLKDYARHYQTGEPISDALIAKMQIARTFNQGFATTEYVAASYLDMAWHTRTTDEPADVDALEAGTMNDIGIIDAVDPRYKSTYFQHIFTGDHYSAGYYSYLWAEVLDQDGYAAFKENGLFDAETAASFRRNVLERGGSDDPMALYVSFRGREPSVQPLLEGRGLV